VWSRERQPELDALRRFVNPKDRGEVSDPVETGTLHEFMRTHSVPAPTIEKDDSGRETSVKGGGDVLASVIRMEDH
jgi:hypothetical protein